VGSWHASDCCLLAIRNKEIGCLISQLQVSSLLKAKVCLTESDKVEFSVLPDF
jgi:hypothetical protein